MRFSSTFTIGYHGCDKTVGLDILNGKYDLAPSTNPWDWLGEGSYFWEHNPELALEYAKNVANNSQFASGRIKEPFVLGAIIDLGNSLDISTTVGLAVLKQGYKEFEKASKTAGTPIPQNNEDNRQLDCAVIQYIHELRNIEKVKPYQTIKGSFPEGKPIYPGTKITEKNHIQLCVKDVLCIKGYFLPKPIKKFNPNL